MHSFFFNREASPLELPCTLARGAPPPRSARVAHSLNSFASSHRTVSEEGRLRIAVFLFRRRAAFAVAIVVSVLCLVSSGHSAAQQKDSSSAGTADASLLDLTRASIVTPSGLNVQERTAVRVLVEEVAKRTTVPLR